MSNKQQLHELEVKLAGMSFANKIARGVEKISATLDEGGESKQKQQALLRTMLLVGSGNMTLSGNTLDVNGVTTGTATRSATDNNLPIASYFSGSGGRIYMSFEEGKAQKMQNWITTGSVKDSTLVEHHSSLTSSAIRLLKTVTNSVFEFCGVPAPYKFSSPMLYSRFAATHAAKVDSATQDVKETKLSAGYSFFLGLYDSFFGSSKFRLHSGIDFAVGGKGKEYLDVDGIIKSDGSSGHLYFNTGSSKGGDYIGIGMEGTAPGAHGKLGAHSMVGAADSFSASEGEKNFKDKKEMKVYKKSYLEANPDKDNGAALPKGLYDLKDTKGNNYRVTTSLGGQMLERGLLVPHHTNGHLINYASNNQNLNAVLSISDEILSKHNNMSYYKPANNVKNFLAQKEVFGDVQNMPALKANPQLSLKDSFIISKAYKENNVAAKALVAFCENEGSEILSKGNLNSVEFKNAFRDFVNNGDMNKGKSVATRMDIVNFMDKTSEEFMKKGYAKADVVAPKSNTHLAR